MKWRDSDEQGRLGVKSARDYLEEEVDSRWSGQEDSGVFGALSKGIKKFSPIMTGVALFVVVLGGLKIIFSEGGGVDSDQLRELEERIQAMEEKYEKFDSIDSKVTTIWEQAKSFETFKDRFDRTEASMTLRMDHLATSVDSVQKRLSSGDNHDKTTRQVRQVQKKYEKTASKKLAATAAVRYHTVAAKETLYSISHKYGIKLDNLLEMNNMGKDSVIQPGQKLIVKK